MLLTRAEKSYIVYMDAEFADTKLGGFLTMVKKIERVAIYTRVSTKDQSTERQVRELRKHAKARGWKVIHEVEEHASGAADNRPKREEILTMARKREVDIILVLTLDRWGRSIKDLVFTLDELKSLGVAFVCPGFVDMTTAMGRMMAHLVGAMAEFEKELIKERVLSGLANARSKGRIGGRPRCNTEDGLALLQQGKSYSVVSKETKLSVSTLVRARRNAKAKDMKEDKKTKLNEDAYRCHEI